MKISSSDISLASARWTGQKDEDLKETVHSAMPVRPVRNRPADPGTPVQTADRISLSQTREEQTQYKYSARLRSSAKVENQETVDTLLFEHQEAVEKLAGALLDQGVKIRSLGPSISHGEVNPGGGKEWTLVQTRVHYEGEQAFFSSTGSVLTEDGRSIKFSLDLTLDRSFLSATREETRIRMDRVQLTDPLVINLDKGVPALSDLFFEFDLDNDGELDQVHFTSPGSGFLALDRNQDRKINTGSELFGPGTGNGFGELAVYDVDRNNWIDENDEVFAQLRVWTRDERGQDRLISLKEAGVGAIYLGSVATQFNLTDSANGLQGRIRSSGLFLREDGDVGSIQQIDLAKKGEASGKKDSFRSAGAWRSWDSWTGLTARGGISRARIWSIPGPAAGEEISGKNPLDQLQEKIRELKEKMKNLLEPDQEISGALDRQREKRSRSGDLFYRRMNFPYTDRGLSGRMRI